MKYLSLLFLLLGLSCKSDNTAAPEPPIVPQPEAAVFPGAVWGKIQTPEDVGFSSSKLDLIHARYDLDNSDAFLVIYQGKILFEKGRINERFQTHSVRKSLLSALYGNYVADGTIDLNSTMADLGIDDNDPLTTIEESATVKDLLKARSGIYHPALFETTGMSESRPERGSHDPGTFWYYNNWDFNALGTIFTQQTTKSISQTFYNEIAQPLQMEYFRVSDGTSVSGTISRHNAYPFRMTASDLARFGVLMLNNGKWKNTQIIPSSWVTEMTTFYSDASYGRMSGYGYMWWLQKNGTQYPLLTNATLPEGSYMASGVGGQILLVIPEYKLVIVHRVNTDVADRSAPNSHIGRLVQLVLNAKL